MTIKEDQNGFVIVDCVLTNEGVMPYWNAKDGVMEYAYMPGEELAKLHDTSPILVVTVDHWEDSLSPKTYKDQAVGQLHGKLTYEDGQLKGQIALMDMPAILDAFADGKFDVSIGYSQKIDRTSGTFTKDGQESRYDYVKRGIKLNHLSIVEEGRAENARLVFDSLPIDLRSFIKQNNMKIQPNDTPNTETVGGVTPEATVHQAEIVTADTTEDQAPDLSLASLHQLVQAIAQSISSLQTPAAVEVPVAVEVDTAPVAVIDETQTDSALIASLKSENEALKMAIALSEGKIYSADDLNSEVQKVMDAWNLVGTFRSDSVAFDASLSASEVNKAYLKANLTQDVELDSKDGLFLETLTKIVASSGLKVNVNAKEAPVQDSAFNGLKMSKRDDGSTGFNIFNKNR